MHPDREHLHHALIGAGLGVRATFVVLIFVTVLAGAAGIGLRHAGAADWFSFSLYIAASIGLVWVARRPGLLRPLVPRRWLRDFAA